MDWSFPFCTAVLIFLRYLLCINLCNIPVYPWMSQELQQTCTNGYVPFLSCHGEFFLHLNPTKLHKAEFSKHIFPKTFTTIGCSSWLWKVPQFTKLCLKTNQTSLQSLFLEHCTSHLAMALPHQGVMGHNCFALCHPLAEGLWGRRDLIRLKP